MRWRRAHATSFERRASSASARPILRYALPAPAPSLTPDADIWYLEALPRKASDIMSGPRPSTTRLASVLAASLALAAGSAGCGSSSVANFPPKVITSVVYESSVPFADLQRFQVVANDFTVPAGNLQITVDWSSPTDDLDIVLSNPACDTLAFAAGVCKVLGSERTNVKPERLSMTTTATAYRLFVVNLGPQAESGTVVVRVTQARLEL
jgi:hypothetical protein